MTMTALMVVALEAIVAVISAVVSALSTSTIITAVIGAVVSTGLGLAANALFGKKPASTLTSSPLADRNNQIKANINSNVGPIPVIYGKARVGGQLVYVDTTKDHEYLFIVITVCEGKIKGFGKRIYLNGSKYTASKYKDTKINIRTRIGSDHQSSFSGSFTKPKIPGWGSRHRLLGCAAIAARIRHNAEIFTSPPVITSTVKGKKVYDPRDGETRFSNNPALCIRDYLSNSRYGCSRSDSEINDDSFEDAANYCDQTVTLNNGKTQKRYTCNGVVDTSKTLQDNMRDLLTCCRGMLIFTGGVYKLVIDKAETATFTFTVDNIIGGINIHQLGKREKKNRVEATFIDPKKKYEPNIAVAKSTVYLAEDNDSVLTAQLDLPFTNKYSRAAQIAMMCLKQSRQKFVISFKATIKALQVEPGEVVYVTHADYSWSSKAFRVVRIELDQNDEVSIEAVEYDSDVYDLSTVIDVDPSENDFNDTVPPVNLFANVGMMGLLSDGGEAGTRTLNSATRWQALAFIAPDNVALSKYKVYINSVTGSPGANDLTCDIQADSNGKPSNTALQTVNTVTSAPSAGSFMEFTGFTYVLTKGTRYWLVVKNVNGTPASNYVSINNKAGASFSQFVHGATSGQWNSTSASTLNSGTNWSLHTNGGEIGMFRLEFADGTYLGSGITAQTNTTTTNGVFSTRMTGAKFTSPAGVTLRVAGVSLNFFDTGTPTGNPVAKIYEDTTLLATSIAIPLENIPPGTADRFYFPLTDILEIEPSTVLRVVLAEETNSDTSANRWDVQYYTVENVASTLALKPFDGTLSFTHYDGSSWTDTTTAMVPVGLVLDPNQPFKDTEEEEEEEEDE